MMKFFHPVSIFATTGKTEKGRLLQKMALKFDNSLIHGDNSAIKLTIQMREIAAVLDARYPRTLPTFIDCHIDDCGNGQIVASVASNANPEDSSKDIFRITFNTVEHSATIDEVIDRLTLSSVEKGGAR